MEQNIQDVQTTTIFDQIIPVIDEISKKYDLAETPDKKIKKIIDGKIPKEALVVRVAADYLRKIISDVELLSSLEKNLEISDSVANKIFMDIKNKLIPVIEKTSTQPIQPKTSTLTNNIPFNKKPTNSLSNSDLKDKNNVTLNPSLEKQKKDFDKQIPKISKPQMHDTGIKKSGGKDAYREPI